MVRRSLSVSKNVIRKVNQAFERTGWTQQQLADEVGLQTRQPIGKFLKGQSVDRNFFIEICNKLNLDWQEIADLSKNADPELAEDNHDNNSDIDGLVQEVREKVCPSIQEKCGTMRVLDMSQPIGLNDIYTEVNILEKITASRRREIAELMEGCDAKDFDRVGLGKITEKGVPGLEAVEKYLKLIVLGKPGAGKTTFLKHLAIQCGSGQFQGNRVPIFITLKDFAETEGKPCLLTYITQMLASYNMKTEVEQLLMDGRVLVLLDGLDEVRKEDNKRVLKQICDFSEQYKANQFVMTCRIAAKEYTFEKFTEVEVADFNPQQIESFSRKWFEAKEPVKAERFMEKLGENQPIKELAANPLLLTLLCLVFEERANFPSNRSELYDEGLDVLLEKWDGTRNIERDGVYKKLSLKGKKDLLSQIALATFERGDYFFKRKEVEKYIYDYIRNIPNASNDLEELHLDSEVILKSIEAQHGLLIERAKRIYSFSHLTFQEYFTAKKIVEAPASEALEQLENLSNHITEKRWREVFLLAVGMLSNAGGLLRSMKEKTDELVASDEKIQKLLSWSHQKSLSGKAADESAYESAAERAFYGAEALSHDLTLAVHISRSRAIDLARAGTLDLAFADDLASTHDLAAILHDLGCAPTLVLAHDLAFAHDLAHDLSFTRAGTLDSAIDLACARVGTLDSAINFAFDLTIEPELQNALQELKVLMGNLNTSKESEKIYLDWWQVNGRKWINTRVIEQRNIGHDWQFTQPQLELLSQYYSANQLLVDCLNSACYVSREVRQKIENTLLLPIDIIKKSDD